jgi:hypothetical protein
MFCLVLLLEIDGEINSWKKLLSDLASIVYWTWKLPKAINDARVKEHKQAFNIVI